MKVKRISRKIGACGKETLIEAIGRALAAVSTEGARSFFAHCGYHAPVAATMKDAVRRYFTMYAFQGVQKPNPAAFETLSGHSGVFAVSLVLTLTLH